MTEKVLIEVVEVLSGQSVVSALQPYIEQATRDGVIGRRWSMKDQGD